MYCNLYRSSMIIKAVEELLINDVLDTCDVHTIIAYKNISLKVVIATFMCYAMNLQVVNIRYATYN